MNRHILALALASMLLVACGDRSPAAVPTPDPAVPAAPVAAVEPPPPAPVRGSCSHPDTAQAIIELVQNQVGSIPNVSASDREAVKEVWREGAAHLELALIRTTALDSTIGRSQCEAQLQLRHPPGAAEIVRNDLALVFMVGERGWKYEAPNLAARWVTYSAQLTDDRQHVVVELAEAGAAGGGAGLFAVATAAAALRAADAAQAADPCGDASMQTGAGLKACADHQYAAADVELNAAYKAAMGALPTERSAALRNEQRAWLVQRDAACTAEVQSSDAPGGTAGELNFTGCLARVTAERTEAIRAFR